ncbi:tyrosine-type recombinase/integrase [Niabella drilacis]|nr:site-specific integrase [Niabella drilacis]
MINRGAKDSLKIAFDEKAKELRAGGKVSSAVNFECCIRSIEKHKKGLRLADVTPAFLKTYERHMLDNGKSKSTIGIYLRSLRVIMNETIADGRLDKSLYPFRKAKSEKGKYTIPTSRNIKKAMSAEDLSKLFYYRSEIKAIQQAADFWKLSFLCNGMNIKDLLTLKWKNVDGDFIKFERSKTSDTKDVSEPIIAHLKPEAMAIIRKYGVKSLSPESLVFPVLSDKMDAERQYMKIQNFVHHINKNLAKICKDLKIPKITTYAARHSFATRLMQNGANVAFIQKSLGHTSSKTTAAYLGSFENDAIKDLTDKIIPIREVK